MNTNKTSGMNNFFSLAVGLIIFIVACYFVFNLTTKTSDTEAVSQNFEGLIRPEVSAYMQTIEKESSYLKEKDFMQGEFIEKLKDFSEKIPSIYPEGRSNPFIKQ